MEAIGKNDAEMAATFAGEIVSGFSRLAPEDQANTKGEISNALKAAIPCMQANARDIITCGNAYKEFKASTCVLDLIGAYEILGLEKDRTIKDICRDALPVIVKDIREKIKKLHGLQHKTSPEAAVEIHRLPTGEIVPLPSTEILDRRSQFLHTTVSAMFTISNARQIAEYAGRRNTLRGISDQQKELSELIVKSGILHAIEKPLPSIHGSRKGDYF